MYEISCGIGDKSFKWLSLVATQRYALAAPNGALRRRDGTRCESGYGQQLASNIVLPDGSVPHPGANICDFLKDEEEVVIYLGDSLTVNKLGTATATSWSTVAFTTSEEGYDDSGSATHLAGSESDRKQAEEAVDPLYFNANDSKCIANSKFMKIIMRSQMLDYHLYARQLEEVWPGVVMLIPRVSEDEVQRLKELCFAEWGLLKELFKLYCEADGTYMNMKELQSLISDSRIFEDNVTPVIVSRTYDKIQKLLAHHNVPQRSGLSIVHFIAALLFIAQTRYNDTLEKKRVEPLPSRMLQEIVTRHLRPVAVQHRCLCLLKEVLCSDAYMLILNDTHDDLMAVFEKYASKHNRDVFTSLPLDNTADALVDAQLHAAKDVKRTTAMFAEVRKGDIVGRDRSVQPPLPEDELLFPEFVEVVSRSAYELFVVKREKPSTIENIMTAYRDGLRKAIATLSIVEVVQPKGYYRGPQ